MLLLLAACAAPEDPWLGTCVEDGACGVAGCTSRGPRESRVTAHDIFAAAATILRLLGEVPDEVGDAALLARLHEEAARGEGGDSPEVLLGLLSLHGIAAEVLDPAGELDRVALSGTPIVARMGGRYVVIAPTRGGRVVRLGEARGRVGWAAAFVQGRPPPR